MIQAFTKKVVKYFVIEFISPRIDANKLPIFQIQHTQSLKNLFRVT